MLNQQKENRSSGLYVLEELAQMTPEEWNALVLQNRVRGTPYTDKPICSDGTIANIDLAGKILWNLDFCGIQISEVSFNQCDMRAMNLSDCDIVNADFSGALLYGVNFSRCKITGSDFTRAHIYDCDFSGAKLDKSVFSGADICTTSLKTIGFNDTNLIRCRVCSFVQRNILKIGEPYSWQKRPVGALVARCLIIFFLLRRVWQRVWHAAAPSS